MPLFLYRCPKTGHRVQGFSADDVSKDAHIYEPVVCTVCKRIHHVNPATGAVLAVSEEQLAGSGRNIVASPLRYAQGNRAIK